MSKTYQVEAKFGSKWIVLRKHSLQTDALHDVKINGGESYPLRIVRVVKTVVFEDNSHGKDT